VAICHVDDMGKYKLINVSANAQKAHLAHGDGLPGVNGLGADCSVVVADPFAFVSLALVFFEESFYKITWTVQGAPSAVSFDVLRFIPPSPLEPMNPGTWEFLESVSGTGPGSYTSVDAYGAGQYRIVATLSDGTVVESNSIVIP
jgi:hypothetical protein